MERHSNRRCKCPCLGAVVLLLIVLSFWGCMSFRIEKATEGTKIQKPPAAFAAGRTTLAEVLDRYGAPAEIINMKGHFALIYQHAFYRGGHFSFSIPLSDLFVSPALGGMGRFQRYDSAVFVFTREGMLFDMAYEEGSASPLWKTYWQ